jgi:hypothetical protein
MRSGGRRRQHGGHGTPRETAHVGVPLASREPFFRAAAVGPVLLRYSATIGQVIVRTSSASAGVGAIATAEAQAPAAMWP